MICIIENQARNDQIQMFTAETQMALGEIRGIARIFPEVRTFFLNLGDPPPPHSSPTANLNNRSTHLDVISSPLSTVKTGLGDNDLFMFYTVPLAI